MKECVKQGGILPNKQNKSSVQQKYLLNLSFLCNNTFTQRKVMLYTIIALFLGIYFTLVSYPGVLYFDSYSRWDTANSIVRMVYQLIFSERKAVEATIPITMLFEDLSEKNAVEASTLLNMPTEHTSELTSYILSPSTKTLNKISWLNITPQFFMALLYLFTFNIASFTFVQVVLFFFSSFLMIDKFVYYGKPVIIVLFILCPIFYGFSVYHEMSVGCVIGINFGLLLLSNEKLTNFNHWKVIKKSFYAIGIFTCYYIAFGFRANAFTTFPIIVTLAIYLYKKYKDRILLMLQIGCICVSLFFANLFPSILGITVLNGSSPGFVWEILCIIQEMPKENQIQYNEYLDFIAGNGCTIDALTVNSKSGSVNLWLWDVMGTVQIGNKNVKQKIMQKYFHLAFTEFNYFIRTKLYFIGRTLGIQEPLLNIEYDYNRADKMHYLGMVDNQLRYWFVRSYNKFQEITPLFRVPWIWFSIGLMLVIWQLIKTDKGHSFYSLTLYLLSIFYYTAFIINTQSFEFRYFFPSFYYIFIVVADSVSMIWHKYSINNTN